MASLEGKGRSPGRPPTGEVLRELVEQGQSEGLFRLDKDANSIGMMLGALLAQTALLASQVSPEDGIARARSLLDLAQEGIGPQKSKLRPTAPTQSLSEKE